MTTVTPNSAPDNAFAFNEIKEKWDVPGVAIATLKDGAFSTQVSGLASVEAGVPLEADTILGIGSISKVFTATLAVALVDAGLLNLDTPVLDVFPELALSNKAARESLTMRQLLTHTGGFSGDGFRDVGNDDGALQRFVSAFGELEQIAATGAYWSYSNNGFGLAGAIIERVSGLTFEAAMRTYVLDPLGMDRTGFGQPPALPNSATGYEFGPNGEREMRAITGVTRSANPAGGMVSTVGDLIRFAQFHLGTFTPETRVLTDTSRLDMQSEQVGVNSIDSWGIGWQRRLLDDGSWTIEHGGWYNGFRAQLTLIPGQSGALAILCNGPRGHAAIEEIQREILADEFKVREATTSTISVPADVIAAFPGCWKHSHMDVEFRTGAADHAMTMFLKTAWHGEANDSAIECPLLAIANDEWMVDGGEFDGSKISMLRAADGSIAFVRVLNRLCRRIG